MPPIPAPDLPSLCLALTEQAPLPTATVEGVTHILHFVNPAFCTLVGKPSDQLIGKPLSDFLPNKDVCISLLDRVFHTGRAETYTEKDDAQPHPLFWSYTMWPLQTDGLLVAIMIQVAQTAESHGLTVAMNEALLIGSVRQHELAAKAEQLNTLLREEIIERQRAADALRASEERYRTLFEMGPVGVYSCDATGTIQEYNRTAVELWGRHPAMGESTDRFCGSFKMIGADGLAMIPDACPMADVVSGRIPAVHDVEVILERPDGSRSTVVVNIRQLKNERGEITGAINCFYDVTAHKLLEDERATLMAKEQAARQDAEAANRSKDLFLATLSHEVRTPLNAILGWATILRMGNYTEADVKEGMEVIERNCNAQAKLIEDVLDVSRIVSGKLQLHITSCELVDVIKAAIDVVQPAANAKNIRFETDLDPTASHSACDVNRIQQIVWNLLANAVKFSPKGGVTRISLTRHHNTAQIQITDEGQGLTPDFLPYVFDRFRQAEGSTTRKHGGLGLGLSIVKHLVELHGGTVSASSPGNGRGSTFTVNLPVRAVHIKEVDELAPIPLMAATSVDLTGIQLDGLHVLVVDDEPDARRLLAKVLTEAGARITAVGSVKEALAVVAADCPQVLLSDIAMPDHDGFELIRQIRDSGHSMKDLPAVALTAFAHKDDRVRVLLAGFQIHVPKPIDPHELIAVIASLTGRTG